MGPKEHFQSNVLKQVFKRFNFFRVLVKTPWQQRTIIFLVDKIAKSVSRNKLRKIYSRGKNFFNFFKFLSEVFFAISEKLPAWLSKLQSPYLFKVLRENICFLKLNMISTFFGLWDEKNGSFSQKVFFMVQPTKISASRELFRWKKISLSKMISFSVIIFGVSVISLSFCKVL